MRFLLVPARCRISIIPKLTFPRIPFHKNYSLTPETSLNRRVGKETVNPRLKTLDNFDPERQPNETSAVYTRFGWFYIPTEFYLDGKIGVEIQNSLDDKGVTLETPKSEIQKLILEWCRQQPYEPKKKIKQRVKRRTPDVILNKFFINGKNGSVEEEKPEPLVIEQKRKPSDETLARRIERETYRVTPRSIFARYDENTGKYEIKGHVSQNAAFQYYLSKEWDNYKGQFKTKVETRVALGESWKKKTPEEKEALRLEFLEMLQNGQDLASGKIIPLESRLSTAVFNDGFRLRVRSDHTKNLMKIKQSSNEYLKN